MVKQIGFRPSAQDINVIEDLLAHYNELNVIGSVTQTDIIKLALKRLHDEVVKNNGVKI